MASPGRALPASAIVLAISMSNACVGATVRAPEAVTPMDTPAHTPTPAADRLLDPAFIARLPAQERDAWSGYLARSEAKQASERAAMEAELREAGREQMIRAPYVRQSFEVSQQMTPDWIRSAAGRRLAESILSYQTPSGGWSKHVDFTQGSRAPGQSYYSASDGWAYIGTIDNEATTSQLDFLAAANAAQPDERYRSALLKGLDYLLDAQYPNGCLPQVYPLQGGYHDAVTFNDDAVVNVLGVFRDVGRAEPYAFVPAGVRVRVADALARGLDCIVRSQVVVDGVRTVWAQQHHPVTLVPVSGRSYELAALSGRESAGITEFLMSLSRPPPPVIEAVHAAVDWLRKAQIHGYVYSFTGGLSEKPGAGPIWARLYEIGSNRPIFSDRDGVKLYDWNQLTDRRQGYGWFGTEPLAVLEKYDETWATQYPRQRATGAAPGPWSINEQDADRVSRRSVT